MRSGHKIYEGKVFKHENNMIHPGEDYGCRCYKQKLPIHAKIIEKENKMMFGEFSVYKIKQTHHREYIF